MTLRAPRIRLPHHLRRFARLAAGAAIALLPVLSLARAGTAAGEAGSPAEAKAAAERELHELEASLDRLRPEGPDRLSDADLFRKSAAWALRYDTLSDADLALVRHAIVRGKERAEDLTKGRRPWAARKGRLVRAYTSRIDGSTQPYMLIVPKGYDPSRPIRLDVVLHGSSRPVGMSELRFLSPFDQGDTIDSGPDAGWIELHPIGRVENGYRWAGEEDVFEAIEDVCRCYRIDRDRIVLRGMSMGASGTWHLGLKHPDQFVALGPYCGYVDTHRFSETPGMNFIKVGPLPEWQEKTLHMLDSVDYAANAGVVPCIGAIGDKDPFFQAHVIMGEAMSHEGLKMVNLISPGTGHVQDPVTHAKQLAMIAEYAERGLPHVPQHLRFVTWTLKYSRCHWLQVLGLEKHYARTEVDAVIADQGRVEVRAARNVSRLALVSPANRAQEVVIDGKTLKVPKSDHGATASIVLDRGARGWSCSRSERERHGKRPGVQGPIDDAFTSPFLCVRGTGTAWNPKVAAWSDANLRRFQYEWNRYFRGELPVKDDTAVTADDLRRCNLILFGDPGSNRWIRKSLGHLPIQWTRSELRMGGSRYAAADYAPALICESPLAGANGRYVVLNSGHTFHEKELASLNYLLFPHLGDWGVWKLGSGVPKTPSDLLDEQLAGTGLLNEDWQFPR